MIHLKQQHPFFQFLLVHWSHLQFWAQSWSLFITVSPDHYCQSLFISIWIFLFVGKDTSPTQRYLPVNVHFCLSWRLTKNAFVHCLQKYYPILTAILLKSSKNIVWSHKSFQFQFQNVPWRQYHFSVHIINCFSNEWHGSCGGSQLCKFFAEWFFIETCTKCLYHRWKYISGWSNLFLPYFSDGACHRSIFSHTRIC